MAIIGSYSGPKWDVSLDPTVCDRYNNLDMTLSLRVYLQQINPAGGAATGTAADHDGVARNTVRWTPAQWSAWTSRYQRECQRYWHGKFWLMTPPSFTEFDYPDRGVTYRPNVWCRFRLQLVSSAAGAHHAIRCVRVAASVPFFRSNAGLYDHRDLTPSPRAHGSPGRTHVHEVGHLLGLGHSGDHLPTCTAPNVPDCYGVADPDQRDVMGTGSVLKDWHAQPWREALELTTDSTRWEWGILMRRTYPRSPEDIARNAWPSTRPHRG